MWKLWEVKSIFFIYLTSECSVLSFLFVDLLFFSTFCYFHFISTPDFFFFPKFFGASKCAKLCSSSSNTIFVVIFCIFIAELLAHFIFCPSPPSLFLIFHTLCVIISVRNKYSGQNALNSKHCFLRFICKIPKTITN